MSIFKLLADLGIHFETFEERMRRNLEGIDERLLHAASSMGVSVYGLTDFFYPFDLCAAITKLRANGRRPLGLYVASDAAVWVDVRTCTEDNVSATMVLAHELVHATATMLERGALGRGETCTWEDYHAEEVTAQYGASLLVKALGHDTLTVDDWTSTYLKHHGRRDGKPSPAEHVNAELAVNLILNHVSLTERKAS